MTSEQIQELRELAQGVSEAMPSATLSRWYYRVLKALPELLDEAEAAERLRQNCAVHCRNRATCGMPSSAEGSMQQMNNYAKGG
jgi:hypothetical protein